MIRSRANWNSTIPEITIKDILNKEFIVGHQENFTQEYESLLDKFKAWLSLETRYSFRDWTRQFCNTAFIGLRYRGKHLSWNQFDHYDWEKEGNGPKYFPTDFGSCCQLVPHLYFDHMNSNRTLENKTFEETWFDMKGHALNGETNGLDIMVDTEQFNYGYHQANAAGFRISLHHHNSKPMISFSSQLIHAGTETIIDIKPTITYTTDHAISRFSPEERGCFTKRESKLNYLKRSLGYHYDLNNCIIDEGIRDIIWNCRCIPHFVLYKEAQEYFEVFPYCTGKGLFCANKRTELMGLKKNAEGMLPEVLEKPEIIGGISKPKSINCLPSCRFQDNYNQMSNAPYPQKQIFFYQKTFCDVASHVLQVTCQENIGGYRRFFIEKSHPNICNVLEDFDKFFGSNSTCNEWPKNFFEDLEEGDKPNSTLNDELFEYGKQNLALIHVMMQSPYATKIKRDVAMTFTNYVANTGGLLGLCLGFSFISFIEIIFWCCFCVKELRKLPVSTT